MKNPKYDYFKLVIIWADGKKDVHYYETLEKAKKVLAGFKTAFGNQIQYIAAMRVY